MLSMRERNLVPHYNHISAVKSGCIIGIDFRSSYGEAVRGLMPTPHPSAVTWKEEVVWNKAQCEAAGAVGCGLAPKQVWIGWC